MTLRCSKQKYKGKFLWFLPRRFVCFLVKEIKIVCLRIAYGLPREKRVNVEIVCFKKLFVLIYVLIWFIPLCLLCVFVVKVLFACRLIRQPHPQNGLFSSLERFPILNCGSG